MSGSFLTGPSREAAQGGQKGDRGGFSSIDPCRFLGALRRAQDKLREAIFIAEFSFFD